MRIGLRAKLRLASFLTLLSPTPGCAIHHYDARTQTEHVWGFGHVALKVQREDGAVQGTLRRWESLGLVVGRDAREAVLGLGWVRRDRLEALRPDASIFVEGPFSDFLDLRIGGEPLGARTPASQAEGEIVR